MTEVDPRRARRAWIAAHHPDRGGDPHAFAAGLAAFDDAADSARWGDLGGAPGRGSRPTVVRSRRPTRLLRRFTRRLVVARRRRTHHGSI